MITNEATEQTIKLIGRYLIDNAQELMPVEYSDLFGDDIVIRLKRRKGREDANENRPD